MSGFRRPGSQNATAFGLSFAADRDTDKGSAPPIHNPNERLSLAEQRRALPVHAHLKEILYLLENHATTVVVGETGSGKTTQIPQYLHEAGWTAGGKMIACTQPRRLAAMTVAARVSEEMGCSLGREVGYAIRFEDRTEKGRTCIKFCTDGVLLREMMSDPLLTDYSVIMVDEAHERSLATDLLLGLLKKIQRQRPDLRIIISSATIEAERMAAFFRAPTAASKPRGHPLQHSEAGADQFSGNPALLSVEGRAHHVQVHYLDEPCSDYLAAAVEAALQVHRQELPGDILIFLTGQDECQAAVRLLEEESQKSGHRSGQLRLQAMPLYAGLPAAQQLEALSPAPRGVRKAIVATNIAETSLTLEGVVYVIDSCFAKQRAYNPLTGLQSVLITPISRASSAQRAGRAGRVRPGHAFRLCTEAGWEALPAATVPEMQRCDLAGAVLQLKALGIDNIMRFEWLAPPPPETMIRALESLHALGALGLDAKLTAPLGNHMAAMPLDPFLSKMLLEGCSRGCVQEMLTIVAMLSVESIWAPGNKVEVDEAKARFGVAEGDLPSFLNIWKAWLARVRDKRWSYKNYVSHRSMLRAADIRFQLESHLKRAGLDWRSTALGPGAQGDAASGLLTVRKACAAGLFMQAARLTEELVLDKADARDAGASVYRLVRSGGGEAAAAKLRIHHSSVLFRCRPSWVCFYGAEQNNTGWYEMRDIAVIEPDWLTELAPHMYAMVHAHRH
ncbi:hypothetical protein ACKKBG_A33890 [Auxenochlorella protothecoides x Auxenochlorella symbiontica]